MWCRECFNSKNNVEHKCVEPGSCICDGPHLTTLAQAKGARDEAVQRVEIHADEEWQEDALNALEKIAYGQPTLIANDLWKLVPKPHEARAAGPVMLKGQKLGLIVATEDFVLTPSVSRHAAPVRVWRSLVYGKAQV